ncbi:MAG: hypothetical protein FWF84_04255 [Kiritimatiellaeota bacterium]|nr:hypothetical protein [Kiritimatiellota bacterium]
MIIDMDRLIDRQLGASVAAEEVVFDAAHSTVLVAARQTPVPSGRRVSLDGAWNVAYRGTGEGAMLEMPGKVFYADPEAEKAEIPGFNRVKLSHIDEKDGARLTRTVTVPEAWAGKRIFVRFDGIYPGGDVFVGGQKALEVRSGLTPEQAEITHYVTAGQEIEIAVDLIRRHAFVQLDMPRHALEFAGLSQPAYLFAVDAAHVADYFLVPSLNADFTAGTLSGEVRLSAAAPLSVEVRDGDALVAAAEYPAAVTHDVRLDVCAPKLWNDEFPNLYTVRLAVGEQRYEYKAGFRRLDFVNGVPKLNGAFVKFRGVNHLTFHPEHGLYTSKEWLRANLGMMKKANVNAIRTHYSGPVALQELCDEMGFYLVQELPIDWGTNYIHDPLWMGPILHRVESIVRRDRHHASVMVWAVGNENMPESAAVADDGWNHLAGLDRLCHRLDPTRPTMFPPPGPANKVKGILELRVGDIADIHYNLTPAMEFVKTGEIANPRSWEGEHETVTREAALARGWKGAFFSSEWGIFNLIPDLLNNPAGSIITTSTKETDPLSGESTIQVFQDRLAFEWGFMRSEPTCLGGAFFPWMCAAAGRDNPWGWMRYGEDADWGVICADLTPKPEFWAMRRAFSPVHLPARLAWRKGQEDVNFLVHNQFNAIDLKACTFRAQLSPVSRWMSMMRKFFDIPVSCPPGDNALVRVPLTDAQRKSLDDGHALMLRLTLLRPDGFKFLVNETYVIPEELRRADDPFMPIGPDAAPLKA